MAEHAGLPSSGKTVIVTGDLLVDHSLLQDDRPTASYTAPMSSTLGLTSAGAAWFLTQLIERAAAAAFPTPAVESVRVVGPDDERYEQRKVAKAYTLWKKYPRQRDAAAGEPWVYRVEQFLGCQREENADDTLYLRLNFPQPDVLVIDDLRLGFTASPKLWPECLRAVQAAVDAAEAAGDQWELSPEIRKSLPQQIVFKLGGPPDGSPLWKLLLRVPELRQRLTAVIYVEHLRQRGSELSKGLSWDRTIEEIQQEFRTGPSAYDLGWCKRVCVVFEGGCAGALFSRDWLRMGPNVKEIPTQDADGKYQPPALQRFLYLPDEIEGVQSDRFEGKVYGATSLVTASLVLHLVDAENFPAYIALGRGLAALRHNQLQGCRQLTRKLRSSAIPGAKLLAHRLEPDFVGLTCRLAWRHPKLFNKSPLSDAVRAVRYALKSDPAFAYFTSWPQGEESPLSERGRGDLSQRPGSVLADTPEGTIVRSDLLGDFAGPTLEYMYAVAARIVREGAKHVLSGAPKASYGKYLTVDRDEIERINAVRSLILTYLQNPADTRPLSIAVFGQPGSGKSFAIKQLLKGLPGKRPDPLVFNLSEFPEDPTEALRQLQSAFHQVRDQSISGAIPLVFWDEFDAGSLKWLKQFLAPMQDAEFRVGSLVHPLGKAIFVFAGGTCRSYSQFEDQARSRAARKGPDFVSRLRGHINIKGPNRDTDLWVGDTDYAHQDPAHLIRRAIILRSKLEQTYPRLIDKESQRAAVSESVLRGLLRSTEYRHGARSLESVLSMSQIAKGAFFGSSQLPPQEQLEMHVSQDFLAEVRAGELTADIIEPLAEACHEAYRRSRKEIGDDSVKAYAALAEDWKEPNRAVARVVVAKLAEIGCTIRRRQDLSGLSSAPLYVLDRPVLGTGASTHPDGSPLTVKEALCLFEHDRWLREKLLQGFEYCDLPPVDVHDPALCKAWCDEDSRLKALRRNTNIRPHRELDPFFQKLDAIAPEEIVLKLWAFGYEIVVPSETSKVS